jgi:hypothetical protein
VLDVSGLADVGFELVQVGEHWVRPGPRGQVRAQ